MLDDDTMLSQAEIVQKYERDQQAKKIAKVEARAMTLQAVEWGTAAVAFTGLAALEEWKPELFKYQIPRIAATLGGLGMYIFSGKKNEAMKEIGSGLLMAGALPLAAMGAKKGVQYIQGA